MEVEENATLFDNLRTFISLIDDLRDCGLQKYITLPRIATLGTQSSGKSSVMESIVGLDFLPRGEGVCTRRPLELRLIHLQEPNAQPWALFEGNEKKYTDFLEVRAQIEKLTDSVAGSNKGIVDDPIILNIHSPTCPDLTLIDLPGITRIPLRGSDQPENIEQITKSMALRYVTDPRTVILCVVPANADLSTSEALQMARQVDPKGIRTLGVLTKIDIMDKGTNAKRIIENHEIPLRLGFVGVKLRSQQDIKSSVSVKESLAVEKDYFANHPVYSAMSKIVLGTESLSLRLTKVLYKHISHLLPDIMREIHQKTRYCEERLRELGTPVPVNDVEKVQLLFSMLTDFCEIFKNLIKGRFDKRRSGSHIMKGLQGGARIKQIFQDLFRKFNKKKYRATGDYDNEDISQAIKFHQGDSIPGFPSVDVFTYLIQPQLEKLKEPVEECVSEVAVFMEGLATRICERLFYRFPSMVPEIHLIVSQVFAKEKENCLRLVLSVIESEENYMFTNDVDYLANRTEIVPEQKGKERKQSGTSIFVEEIRERVDNYFKIVVRNTRDTVPKMIGTFLIRAILESLQFELYKQIQSTQLLQMMGEPEIVAKERLALQKTVQTLKQAQKIVRREPDLAQQSTEIEEEMEKQQEEKKQPQQKQVQKPQDHQSSKNEQEMAPKQAEVPVKSPVKDSESVSQSSEKQDSSLFGQEASSGEVKPKSKEAEKKSKANALFGGGPL